MHREFSRTAIDLRPGIKYREHVKRGPGINRGARSKIARTARKWKLIDLITEHRVNSADINADSSGVTRSI